MNSIGKILKAAKDRIFGTQADGTTTATETAVRSKEQLPGLNAWHTYENPRNGDRIRIYNASPRSMPLEMIVKGSKWAHIHPFSGEPADPATLKAGDFVFRPLDMRERTELVGIRVKAAKKAHRGQSYAMKPDHELKRLYHAEIAKECAVVQIV